MFVSILTNISKMIGVISSGVEVETYDEEGFPVIAAELFRHIEDVERLRPVYWETEDLKDIGKNMSETNTALVKMIYVATMCSGICVSDSLAVEDYLKCKEIEPIENEVLVCTRDKKCLFLSLKSVHRQNRARLVSNPQQEDLNIVDI